MVTSFSTLWTRGVPIAFLSPAGGKKAIGKSNAVLITVALIVVAYLLDSLLTCAFAESRFASTRSQLIPGDS